MESKHATITAILFATVFILPCFVLLAFEQREAGFILFLATFVFLSLLAAFFQKKESAKKLVLGGLHSIHSAGLVSTFISFVVLEFIEKIYIEGQFPKEQELEAKLLLALAASFLGAVVFYYIKRELDKPIPLKSSKKFKRLNQSDVKLMRELNEVFAHAFNDTETYLSKIPSKKYLENLLSKPNVIMLAAFDDNKKIIGGLLAYVLDKYEQERSEIYIYDLAVAESNRRQGIARGLINQLKELSKELNAWAIFVQADKIDEPAVNLYNSIGIKEEPFHYDIILEKEK